MTNWKRLEGACTWLTALAVLSASLQGCTLVGMGVGAGIDSLTPGPYQERPPTELVRLERDQRVIVARRNGSRVAGRYVGTHGPTAADLDRYLLVIADDELVSVKASEVSSIAVEVTGKGWLYGGLVGAVVDATIVVVAVVALNNMKIELSSDPSGCLC